MSFSMLEPEETPVCECRYDEARDMMDREDCPFHRDLVDETDALEVSELGKRCTKVRKKATVALAFFLAPWQVAMASSLAHLRKRAAREPSAFHRFATVATSTVRVGGAKAMRAEEGPWFACQCYTMSEYCANHHSRRWVVDQITLT